MLLLSSAPAPKTHYRKDYMPYPYKLDEVSMTVQIFDGQTKVITELFLTRKEDTATDAPIILNGKNQELVSVGIDDADISAGDYTLNAEDEMLTLPAFKGNTAKVTVTSTHVPEDNKTLMGLYKCKSAYSTQCEPEGFRQITFFPDRPDVMTEFTVRVEADKASCPILLSNGNRIDAGELENDRHFTTWHDPFPKPSYLFALVAGDLAVITDHFTTQSGRKVELNIYSEHDSIDQCGWAMHTLKQAMKWDEQKYGREYDLDLFNIVAISDFNMGAMENKSLNIFNTSVILANRKTGTDPSFCNIDRVIAHEYFHNYSGNRVTCRDWFQLTLKEGLTVLREQDYMHDMYGSTPERIGDTLDIRGSQFTEDTSPMAHPIRPNSYQEIDNFYTTTVYQKGAEVIRILRTIIGWDAYRKGCALYFDRFDGQAVTCEDFANCLAEVSNIDSDLFDQYMRWYCQAGTPTVTVKRGYDADNDTLRLHFTQSIPDTPDQTDPKKPMVIPIKLGLLDAETGAALPLIVDGTDNGDEMVYVLRDASATVTFIDLRGGDTMPVPSLLRDFSAPVKINDDLNDAERLHLMTHDSNDFARWDAGQGVMRKLLLEGIADPDNFAVPQDLIAAWRGILGDATLSAQIKTNLLQAPRYDELCNYLDIINPDAVCHVRDTFREVMASELRDDWLATYRAHHKPAKDTIGPDAAEIGDRSLANLALGYLAEHLTDDTETRDLILAHYHDADNMTNRLSALRHIASLPDADAERSNILGEFYQNWQHDDLSVIRWFGAQVGAKRDDSLTIAQNLTKHEAFSWTTPNKVRQVIMLWALHQPRSFHNLDGSGYRYLTDIVLKLDPQNPSMASGMVDPLLRWKAFDTARQSLMKTELERLHAQEKLSKGVAEKVGKALGV